MAVGKEIGIVDVVSGEESFCTNNLHLMSLVYYSCHFRDLL